MTDLIKGRGVLLGFADAFDGAYGDPKTPTPYAKITPSRLGPALLPFRCPRCRKVLTEFCDPKSRECYRDPKRGHSWCPACGNRMLLNEQGMPLPAALSPGAVVAPSKVEREGATKIQDEEVASPTDAIALLGAR